MAVSATAKTQTAALELIEGGASKSLAFDHLPFTIGRAEGCDLNLWQSYVSRHHAVITRVGGRFEVADTGSRHGTFVNGGRVDRHVLRSEDYLQFGSLDGPRLRFTEADPPELAQPDLLSQVKEISAGKSDLEKLRWLLEAARDLNSAGRVDRVLASLLEATLILAKVERGYVFLSRETGELDLALGMDAEGHVLESSDTLSQTVIRQASEGLDQFIVTDSLRAGGGDVPQSIVAHNIRTIICIPLCQQRASAGGAGGPRLLGLLYLDSRLHAGSYSDIDYELLRTIAREAAALIEIAQLAEIEEQARLYDQESQIAAAIQQGLMAVQIPTFSFARVEAHSVACSAVGGDFYDIIPGEGMMSVAVVDVSGKGMSAAILASTLQGMLYLQLQSAMPLDEIAAAINRYLCAKNVGKYATMLLLRLHAGGLLEYINCGHVQPRLCSPDRVTRLEAGNMPVGLFAHATYAAAAVTMEPGWSLTLVSDGFTEAEDALGDAFGEERFDTAARCSDLQSVLKHMTDFCAAQPATDDCTVVQISYRG